MFGYDRPKKAFQGDSITIDAHLLDESGQLPVPQATINSVLFTVAAPGEDPNASPSVDAQAGTIVGDGHGRYVIPGSINSAQGNYLGKAVFNYDVGSDTLDRTVPFEYTIVDAFERSTTGAPEDEAVALAWLKLEDCFDSELGGPWLRDVTKSHFDHSKVRALIDDVILEINTTMPLSEYTVASFPYENDGKALIAQGLLVNTIFHLIRSYTEQPDVTNNPVAFFDRKRYMERWLQVLEREQEKYRRMTEMWKRKLLNMSGSSLLLSSRAGRSMHGYYRTRGSVRGWG